MASTMLAFVLRGMGEFLKPCFLRWPVVAAGAALSTSNTSRSNETVGA